MTGSAAAITIDRVGKTNLIQARTSGCALRVSPSRSTRIRSPPEVRTLGGRRGGRAIRLRRPSCSGTVVEYDWTSFWPRGVFRRGLEPLVGHQVRRPRFTPADRLILAALNRILPRPARQCFLIRPETLLRCHRGLVQWKWSLYARPPRRGRPGESAERHALIDSLAQTDWFDRSGEPSQSAATQVEAIA